MSVCAKFQLLRLSRSGLKVPSGVVGWGVVGCSGVEAHFSVQLQAKLNNIKDQSKIKTIVSESQF